MGISKSAPPVIRKPSEFSPVDPPDGPSLDAIVSTGILRFSMTNSGMVGGFLDDSVISMNSVTYSSHLSIEKIERIDDGLTVHALLFDYDR